MLLREYLRSILRMLFEKNRSFKIFTCDVHSLLHNSIILLFLKYFKTKFKFLKNLFKTLQSSKRDLICFILDVRPTGCLLEILFSIQICVSLHFYLFLYMHT